MRKPRAKVPGRTYTISATDEEWAAIGAGAARAGKKVSAWAVECALTVDPLPRPSRRLVLDEKQQRYLSRSMDAHARSLCADADAPSRLADDLRALLAARLGAMARQGAPRRGRRGASRGVRRPARGNRDRRYDAGNGAYGEHGRAGEEARGEGTAPRTRALRTRRFVRHRGPAVSGPSPGAGYWITPVTAMSNFVSQTSMRAVPARDDRFGMNSGND